MYSQSTSTESSSSSTTPRDIPVPDTPSNIKVIDWMKNRAVPAGSDGVQTVTSDEDVCQVPTDEECVSQPDVYVAQTNQYLDNVDQSSHDEMTYMLSQIVRRDPEPTFRLDPVPPAKAKKSIHSVELYQSAMPSANNIGVKTVPATPGPYDDDSGYPRLLDSTSGGDTRDSVVNKKGSDEMAKFFEGISDSPPATANNIELQPFNTCTSDQPTMNTSKSKSAAFMDKSTSSSIPYVENNENVPNSDSTGPYIENNGHLISQCTESFTPETSTSNESCMYKEGYISEEKAKLLGGNAGTSIQSSTAVDHQIGSNTPGADSLSTSEFGVYVSHGEGYPAGVMGQPNSCIEEENKSKFTQNSDTQLSHAAKSNHATTTTESQHGSSVDSDCINFDDSPVDV